MSRDPVLSDPVPAEDPEVAEVPERQKLASEDQDLPNHLELDKHIREVFRFLSEKIAVTTSVYITTIGVVGQKRIHEMMEKSGVNISKKGRPKGEARLLHNATPNRYVVQWTAVSTEST